MPDDLTDLLGAASSAASTPSDAPPRRSPKRTEIEELRDRVLWLERSLKIVCDLLADKGQLEREPLRQKLVALRVEIERKSSEQRAMVTCVACGKSIPRDQGHFRTAGVLCGTCHADTRRTRPKLRAIRGTDSPGSYRVTGAVEDRVKCVGCSADLSRSDARESEAGPLCEKCSPG